MAVSDLGDTSEDVSDASSDALERLFQVETLETLQSRFGEQARAYRDAGRSAGTRRVYESAFALFRAWCVKQQASPLPADPRTVAFYLTDAATRYRATTLDLHLAAIAYAHRPPVCQSPPRTRPCARCAPVSAARTAPPHAAKPPS